MTLLLTEISPFGIVMVADSAVTFTNIQTGFVYAQPNLAVKLQAIPYLNAGISCWGMGSIANKNTDHWINDFISAHTGIATLKEFAGLLATEINSVIPANPQGEYRVGFHLSGYEDYNGTPTPSFFHIHDGASTVLAERGVIIDPTKVNPNHDMPPELMQPLLQSGLGWLTRNGDYTLYAQLFGLLEQFFKHLAPIGIHIPNTQSLGERAEYLTFQVRTVSEIYRLSNLVPGIGGGIHFLAISPNGIHSQGVRYF